MASAASNVTPLKPPTTLAGAMARAFAEIEGATKATLGQVGQQKYKYADLTSVIDAIKPALVNNDMFFTQRPLPSENGVTIATYLHHASGEEMPLGSLFVPANKNDAQGFGSALTYARRYALVTAFGVPVEDDDGNAASRHTPPPAALIDEDQWVMLVDLMERTSTNTKAFCTAYGITNVKALPAAAYENALAKLNRKLAEKANG